MTGRCLNCVYPSDLLPFTRRPLFLVIDSESSIAFEAISGAEKGEPAALLLSPRCSAPMGSNDSCRHSNGSLFTIFLTAPLQAFCILVGISSSEVDMGAFSNAEKLLSSSLNDWGLALAACDSLSPVWVQILGDPFLRRLLLRHLGKAYVLNILFNLHFGVLHLIHILLGGVEPVCPDLQQDGVCSPLSTSSP
ncbi:hypothetical protein CRG98_030417 [Punica granatum]|uniref:Uncharacterized protein n=1 Tax=Punica granatum TaxID=22663 RepID=A0A2I0IYX7_PUNGR|nr:hypothetical protein CRG98_030417 [Punica granatum]